MIDFTLIKKFNNLKISAPLVVEDFEKTITDLEELRFALVYWGKIIQRQKKIKFIKAAIKISKEEEYQQQAEDEEKYIDNEKSKFEGEDVANKTDLSLEKLKIAQIIDKETRMNKVWKDEEEDDEEEDSDDAGYTVDQLEAGGKPLKRNDQEGKPSRGGRSGGNRTGADGEEVIPNGDYYKKPKQAKRPTPQKFADIMKADNAFPALDNDNEDLVDDLMSTVTPSGEITSQNNN